MNRIKKAGAFVSTLAKSQFARQFAIGFIIGATMHKMADDINEEKNVDESQAIVTHLVFFGAGLIMSYGVNRALDTILAGHDADLWEAYFTL